MKLLLFLLLPNICHAAAVSYSATVNLAPQTATIEQRVGSSIQISATGGSSVNGASVVAVVPRVWVTNTGSSTTSFAAETVCTQSWCPNVYVPGQTNLFGGSLTIPWGFKFHASSRYPQYGNSLQIGTQTYSVGADISMSDGNVIYARSGVNTVLVNPIALPDSQVSGWH